MESVETNVLKCKQLSKYCKGIYPTIDSTAFKPAKLLEKSLSVIITEY